MKFCTFKYRINYADGESCEGWCPYKGEHISNPYLVKFVQDYFQERKVANQIFIFDVFEIRNPDVWLAHVRNTVEFRFLRAKGFMVDISQ